MPTFLCLAREIMLDRVGAVKHNPGMLSMARNAERLPCRKAGEAFFVSARGSSRGQGRRGYIPETSVRTCLPAPSAFSGPVAAQTAASPCLQPRDCAPWYPTVSNIAMFGLFFRGAFSLRVADCAREHRLARQAN